MKDELGTEILFGEDGMYMTVREFDSENQMWIIIRHGDEKQFYAMDLWEAKQLSKFLRGHIKSRGK